MDEDSIGNNQIEVAGVKMDEELAVASPATVEGVEENMTFAAMEAEPKIETAGVEESIILQMPGRADCCVCSWSSPSMQLVYAI